MKLIVFWISSVLAVAACTPQTLLETDSPAAEPTQSLNTNSQPGTAISIGQSYSIDSAVWRGMCVS